MVDRNTETSVKDLEQSGTQSFKQWRTVMESELTPDESDRIKKMGGFILEVAEKFDAKDRQKRLEETELAIEVGTKIVKDNGKLRIVENASREVNLVATEGVIKGTRLARKRWKSGNIDIELQIPSKSPITKINVPEEETPQEAVEAAEMSREMNISWAKKWLKDAETTLKEKFPEIDNLSHEE